ncbi:hypothetical protein [Streptomyces sp. NPDC086010]|uniref:hypothetical protein n=1 Tax=Streptomyces sp. NPDC086010 TaxID=3365745 RepID=UPI0037CEB67D
MSERGSIAGRRRRAAAVAAAMLCSSVLTGPEIARAGGPPPPEVPAPRPAWSPCIPGSPFDCATVQVPLDYRAPDGRAIDLAVVRHKALDPGRRIGTLFFNPGGPGGPGTVQMPQNYEAFPQTVRERFDIVSWDPRGIGNSTAVNCFGDPDEAAGWSARKPVGFPVGDEERSAWISSYEDLGRRCEQRDPELLRHVSTAETAQDLDLLRRAVGERRLTYMGSPTAPSWGRRTPTSSPTRCVPWSWTATSTRRPGRTTDRGRNRHGRRSCAWVRTVRRRRP